MRISLYENDQIIKFLDTFLERINTKYYTTSIFSRAKYVRLREVYDPVLFRIKNNVTHYNKDVPYVTAYCDTYTSFKPKPTRNIDDVNCPACMRLYERVSDGCW